MLNSDEQSNITWKERMVFLAVGYTLATPFYVFYLARLVKKSPEFKNYAIARILFMPAMSFGMLWYSSKVTQEYLDVLQNKYLAGITDEEIANFDNIYNNIRQQQA